MSSILHEQGRIPGRNGRIIEWGTAQFDNNSPTLDLPLSRKHLECLTVTPIGSPVTNDGEVSVDETVTNGQIKPGSNDQYTLRRNVNGSSANANNMVVPDGSAGTVGDWTGITDGSMRITVDDETVDVTGMDFSGAGTMSDVASTIQSSLNSALSNVSVTVSYAGGSNEFTITSDDDSPTGQVVDLTDHSSGTGTDITTSALLDAANAVENALVTLNLKVQYFAIGF